MIEEILLTTTLIPQRNHNLCWAASTEMILDFFKENIPQSQIVETQSANEGSKIDCTKVKIQSSPCNLDNSFITTENHGYSYEYTLQAALKPEFFKNLFRKDHGTRGPIAIRLDRDVQGKLDHIVVCNGYIQTKNRLMLSILDPLPINKGDRKIIPYTSYLELDGLHKHQVTFSRFVKNGAIPQPIRILSIPRAQRLTRRSSKEVAQLHLEEILDTIPSTILKGFGFPDWDSTTSLNNITIDLEIPMARHRKRKKSMTRMFMYTMKIKGKRQDGSIIIAKTGKYKFELMSIGQPNETSEILESIDKRRKDNLIFVPEILEFPGYQMSFITDCLAERKLYTPTANFPRFNLFQEEFYTLDQIFKKLN